MKKTLTAIIIALTLTLFTLILLIPTTTAQKPLEQPPTEPISPALRAKIEPTLWQQYQQNPQAELPFIVQLVAQADYKAAARQAGRNPLNNRRAMLVETLQQTAQRTQGGVLAALGQPQNRAATTTVSLQATAIRPLWIINAVAARGPFSTVLQLAQRADVESIRLDKQIFLEPMPPLSPTRAARGVIPSNPEWHIAQIRADLVHNALGITGQGVVVANVDTGVDWQHPALQQQYRGYNGPNQLPNHVGNWFDTLKDNAIYPVDTNGHGTHTMGTIVGQNGVGVAPGATWIAVRAFNSLGAAQNSEIHAAYQWLLAPNDDPALAPDIINNSWSNNNSSNLEFERDLEILDEAGIISVFSTGNDGPGSGSVGSPASYQGVLSVGAVDINDEIAIFSGRGPSPWGEIKPLVVAPGRGTVSSLPGGTYDVRQGTSMASPQVAGAIALLLEASPTLSNSMPQLTYVLTSTAVRLGSSVPNNDYGWGRIDVYNAVASVADFGTLAGTVSEQNSPIAQATVRLAPRDGSPSIQTTTDNNGEYHLNLGTNSYDVTVSAFGYLPTRTLNVRIFPRMAVTQNFNLIPEPQGTVIGMVTAQADNQPLTAMVSVAQTPRTATTNAAGRFRLNLPAGRYTLTVSAAGYLLGRQTVTVIDGATSEVDFSLQPAPSILLVDSGRAYQESQARYYEQALDDLLYPYDLWQITSPFSTPTDVPTIAILSQYELVIWSSPRDAPGYFGADETIQQYLEQGGRLFLSGQDIAYFDGGSNIFNTSVYLPEYIKAKYAVDDADATRVTGAAGSPFAGLTFDIAGPQSADNQLTPDVIAATDESLAAPAFYYLDEVDSTVGLAGLQTGLCVPYRSLYLGFGFEAINGPAMRQQIMGQAIDWLLQESAPNAIDISPDEDIAVAAEGQIATHELEIRNLGTLTNTYRLEVGPGQPYNWPLANETALPDRLTIGPCQTEVVSFGVRVATPGWNVQDDRPVTVSATDSPAVVDTVTRTAKSPAPILLVEDGAFYDFTSEYQEALTDNRFAYDLFSVPKNWSGPVPPSPSIEHLQLYPMVIWFTGYDWATPLSTAEEERLAAYLEVGGRLYLSSQDYLYNLPGSRPSDFAKTYFGIGRHTEDFSSTLVLGQADNSVGVGLGPYELDFPLGYNNWTDAVYPTNGATVATVGQAGQPNGLIHAGMASNQQGQWHTHFAAYGLELLAPEPRTVMMERIVGWLNWLGRSTLTTNGAEAIRGEIIDYRLVISNTGPRDLPDVSMVAAFPPELVPLPPADGSGLILTNGGLSWQGPLSQNQQQTFTYRARVADDSGLGVETEQTVFISYPEHELRFRRVAPIRLNFPNLESSELTVTPETGVTEGDRLHYTIILNNQSALALPAVTATVQLPRVLDLTTVDTPATGTVLTATRQMVWVTPLGANGTAQLRFQAEVNQVLGNRIETMVTVEDGANQPFQRTAEALYRYQTIYLPVITQK